MSGESEPAVRRYDTLTAALALGGATLTLAQIGVSAEASAGSYNVKPKHSASKKSWDKIEWQTTYRDDFKRRGTDLGPAWDIAEPIEWHDGWDMFRPENAYTDGEHAVFVVQRHCVTDADEPRTAENAQIEPCPEGLDDVYAGARVEQAEFGMQGAFRVMVKATLPRNNPVDGVRSAAWILNDQPRCDEYSQTDTVELDTFEYIQSKRSKNKPFSTSHVGCDKLDFDVVYHKMRQEPGWDSKPHVYETIYTGELDGNRIIYKIDGEIVAETGKEGWHGMFDSAQDFEDTERADFNRMMGHMFGVVLSIDAFEGGGKGAYAAVNPSVDFPPQKYKVDWVKTMKPTEQSYTEFREAKP